MNELRGGARRSRDETSLLAQAVVTRSVHEFALLLAGMCLWVAHPLHAEQDDAGSRARQALEAGRYAEAEAIYRQLLKVEPASTKLLTNLGISLGLEGKASESAEVFQRALNLRYESKTFVLLAKARCDSGDFIAVRPMLARIVDEEKTRPDLLQVAGPCALEAGDPLDAVTIYELLATDPASVSDIVLVQMTRAYLASAQFFFSKLRQAPGSEPYVQALQDARAGKAETARGAFRDASERSKAFREEATYAEAVKAWRAAPGDIALLYQLSVLSGEQSMKSFARCRAEYAASPYSDQLMAEMLADQGKRDEAVVQYELLRKAAPDLPRLRQDLATLYVQEQDWTAALAVSEEQLRLHPEDRAAAARVSQSLLALERYGELKAFLEPRAMASHAPLWLRLDLATALQKLDDNAGALTQLVAAEKDHPSEKAVHYRLIRLYAALGKAEASAHETQLFRALQ